MSDVPPSWSVKRQKISKLKGLSKNPRRLSKHDAEHLKKSIDKFGQCVPVIVNIDGTIIGGHQRVKILKKSGSKEVDVYMPDRELEDREVDELNIRLNRNNGEWDFDILANEWEVDDLLNWGFLDDELSIDTELIDQDDEEDEIPEEPPEPKTQLGDLYELGEHRLLCGDSTNPDDVSKLLDGREPILMVTDPPYGVNYDPSWREERGKASTSLGKVNNDDNASWALAWSLFPGSVAYVWCASMFLSTVEKDLVDAEFEPKQLIIWAKQHFAISRNNYHWQHEPCWYAIKKGHNHNWQGSRKESTVWEISNHNCFGKNAGEDEEKTDHSTQKPIECMKRPIINNTEKGQHVYDPFLGSGTTLIAAQQTGRTCSGMELNPAYCDIIVNRWVNQMKRKGEDATVIKNGQVDDG